MPARPAVGGSLAAEVELDRLAAEVHLRSEASLAAEVEAIVAQLCAAGYDPTDPDPDLTRVR